MPMSLLTVEIHYEQDVVLARQRSRQIAARLGFDVREQAWVATAVSEIARNAFQYGGGGRVEFRLEEQVPPQLEIVVRDQGAGIPHLPTILNGHYTSATGLGLGIVGARRLMDRFQIESAPGQGTTVVMGKALPRRATLGSPINVAQLVGDLVERSPQNPFEEMQQQNQELLRTLEELRKREEELNQLNRELADTNRGVVALYAELDEKAASLQRANEIKTRFLSNMSHEFRTPVNAILALTGLLLGRRDGPLVEEQAKQVNFIRQAAEALSDLVNDLLDLAKVEAGKVDIRTEWFAVSELFGTLRGMLRPLVVHNPAVSLMFVEAPDLPLLYSDNGKVAQILRNFISNALKFTEQGEVRVSAELQGDRILFHVTDTGIGIAPADQDRIFEDFVQLDSRRQRQVRGTGLGLPLSRRLAELLGGSVAVSSTVGQGSTFTANLPVIYGTPSTPPPATDSDAQATPLPRTDLGPAIETTDSPTRATPPPPKLLLIDDDPVAHYLLQQALPVDAVILLLATDGATGLALAQTEQPQAILLDWIMPTLSGDEVLTQLAQQPTTQTIPVIVQTSRHLSSTEIAQLQPRAIAILAKGDGYQEALLQALVQAHPAFREGLSHG